jgi:hypothetical protein
MVKFTNYDARFRVYSNRSKLKALKHKIYINEDLTKRRHNLLKRLLELKKQKVVSNAWSNDGRLFVWKNNAKILIKNSTDIDNLRK